MAGALVLAERRGPGSGRDQEQKSRRLGTHGDRNTRTIAVLALVIAVIVLLLLVF